MDLGNVKIVFKGNSGLRVEVERLKKIPIFPDTPKGELWIGENKYFLDFAEIYRNEGKQEYFEQNEGLAQFYRLMLEEDITFDEVNQNLKEIGFTFSDITDKEFNRFQAIPQSVLTNQGLWTGNGIRQIAFEIRGLNVPITKAYFNKLDNREIEKIVLKVVQKEIDRESLPVILLDTDRIEEIIGDNPTANLYGAIELDQRRWKYVIPFNIKFLNPELAPNVWQKNETVAVDFGTFSTYVAVDKGRNLIPFTDNPRSTEDYENATALIIFNWREIYKNWSGEAVPHFIRSLGEEVEEDASSVDFNKYHYNYSSYVKEQLRKNTAPKVIEAVINKIKLLPQHIESHPNDRISFKPFDDFRNLVYLTDSIEEENDETLNPIAFYGYLICRALNKQINNKIYTRYYLTMPVKFNENQKNKIQTSLEYGIKKGIPKKLREKVEVKFKIEEPVALIGALKRIKKLKIPRGKKALPFAIFDFGGGTLDFAFGIYRKPARIKDLQVLENEVRYRDIVEIFRTDGINVGGETIIDSISYQIYKYNGEIMEEKQIPILVPEGETPLPNFNQRLLTTTHLSYINLQTLNERISRWIFKGEPGEVLENIVERREVNVELADEHGNIQQVTLQINMEEIEEFTIKQLTKLVRNFRTLLIGTFGDFAQRLEQFGFEEEFSVRDVTIYLSGNTIKSKLLPVAFQTVFCIEKELMSVEELESRLVPVQDENKGITVKNAVARGALYLSAMGVYNYTLGSEGKMPLDRFIWNIENLEEGDTTPVFMPGDNERKEFNIISRFIDPEEVEIFHSTTSDIEDEDDPALKRIIISIPEHLWNEDYYFLLAKPYDGSIIEVALGNEEGRDTTTFFIDLNSAEVKEEL